MPSKTPKFDEALEKYFSKLELDEQGGQERICRISGEKFYVMVEDIKFYKRIGVSLPTLSPQESMRNKLAWINLYNLFFNKSDKTGKKIVSSYPENTRFKIWEHKIWRDTDLTGFGLEYDLKEDFFTQYEKFQLSIPRPNLILRNAVNSDYTHVATDIKNSFLVFDTENTEDSQYCGYVSGSKNCYHCYATTKSDICYEDTNNEKLYSCFFTEFSNDCISSAFLFDCRDCSDCFMCSNLRHKKYCFENKQFTKEEYQEKMKGVNLGSRKEVKKFKKQFKELKNKSIHRANHNEKNVNCTGDFITNSKKCLSCFYVMNSENMKYIAGAFSSRDCMDAAVCLTSELVYNSIPWDTDSYNLKFCGKIGNSKDCEYCDLCSNCSNCFACIGLRNKSFCIFNKQYSEKEYFEKIDEIKTQMLENNKYGEFFPSNLCPVPYQITSASSFSGYDDLKVAKKYGYKIEEIEEPNPDTKNEIKVKEVPDDIKDTTDDILSKVIIDKNGKKFRYTKEELEFHRKYNLALPTEHYASILAEKRIALGPIDFNPKYRDCAKCGQKTQVTFPKDYPGAPEKVYCERCYNQEVG